MKLNRLIAVVLTALLIGSLAISCSNEATDNGTTTVTFVAENATRNLNIEYPEISIIPASGSGESYTWHYSATPENSAFDLGKTDDGTFTLDSDTKESGEIPFSQGMWKFKIWAISNTTNKRIFESAEREYLISRNKTNKIEIEVSAEISGDDVSDNKGTLVFEEQLSIKSNSKNTYTGLETIIIEGIYEEDDPNTLKVFKAGDSVDLPAGRYNITFTYKETLKDPDTNEDVEVKYGENPLADVVVYSARTTTISGYIDEETTIAYFVISYEAPSTSSTDSPAEDSSNADANNGSSQDSTDPSATTTTTPQQNT